MFHPETRDTIVSRETQDKLASFVDLLDRWANTSVLISRADRTNVAERHVRDSLALVPFLGNAKDIADLGSGAGFPGLVLALASNRHVTLIEANQRKAAFLREAARVTSAPVSIHVGRIETLQASFDLITARAVAPLERLLALAWPHIKAGGRCLFPKGREFRSELETACRTWNIDYAEHTSETDPCARILEIFQASLK